jgi:hypothetical protein
MVFSSVSVLQLIAVILKLGSFTVVIPLMQIRKWCKNPWEFFHDSVDTGNL